jgi:hypothetical protein
VFYALVQNLTQLNFPVLLIFVVLMSKGTHHRSSQRNFGIALESIEPLVQTALQLGLPIIGVSFHCGSGCHNPETYREALTLAKQALEMIYSTMSPSGSFRTTKKCWLLDIGGRLYWMGWSGRRRVFLPYRYHQATAPSGSGD